LPIDTQGCRELPFSLLSLRDGWGVENVLWGTWQQMTVRAFDYWFFTESTDSKGHLTRSYSLLSCAVTEIPAACSPLGVWLLCSAAGGSRSTSCRSSGP
jgi:hypothetical protein